MSDSSGNAKWTRNMVRQLSSALLSKTADQLTNPKTVLAWLMGAIGAPVALVGWLVPIRESLSMLPQFLMAGWIRSRAYRKPVWLLGAGVQGLAVLGMVITGWKLSGQLGGWMLLVSLVVFSLGRALCSIAGKDILGKTIPKNHRGRVNGLATSGSGLLTLIFGIIGFGFFQGEGESASLLIPLMIAVGFWFMAFLVFAGIKESAGEIEPLKRSGAQLVHAFRLLREDAVFRNFVIARALMTGSALAAPYVVLYSQYVSGRQLGQLGGFIFAGAFASMISGWIWGHMADISSRMVLVTASLAASVVCFGLLMMRGVAQGSHLAQWLFPACYLILSIAHDGVRVGRKTFLVNLGSGNKRTDYVSISNSLIGCFLVFMGVFVSLLHQWPTAWVVLIFGIMSFSGALWSGCTLPRLENPKMN